MAAGRSTKRVLLLFTEDQGSNAEKLRTVLESEADGVIEVVDLVDISVANSSLAEELRKSDSTVLICSPSATELIDKEAVAVFKDDNEQEICFDGKIISEYLKDGNGNLKEKLIPVSFVQLPSVLRATRGRQGCSPVCFGVKQGKVTEKMLEGEVMGSLIAIIKGK